ncbi:MAG: DUF2125 domain-containing protein [Sphingomonadales bacterium]
MRYLTLAAIIMLTIVAGYSALWFYAAGRVEDEVRTRMAQFEARGSRVEAGLEISGFPFQIIADFDRPAASSGASGTAWSWSADHARALIQPWDPDRIDLVLDGKHSLALYDGGNEGRELITSEIAIARGRASLAFDADGLVQFSASLSHVGLGNIAPSARGLAVPAVIDHLQLLVRRGDDEGVRALFDADGGAQAATEVGDAPLAAVVALSVKGATIPGLSPTVLGPAITALEAESGLYAHEIPAFQVDELVTWAARGGRLQLSYFNLDWGPLKVKASGPIAVDGGGRPIVALEAFVTGHAGLFDAFAESGLIEPSHAASARMLVDLLPRQGPEDALMLPIIIDQGLLYLGPVPITSVGAISDLAPAMP